MIENDEQYRKALERRDDAVEAIAEMRRDAASDGLIPDAIDIILDPQYKSLRKIESDIRDYETRS